ncbi:MAG: hypothetical protein ACFNYD_08765, partial [Bacteroides sp.]
AQVGGWWGAGGAKVSIAPCREGAFRRMQSPNPWEDARGFECMGSVGWYGLVGLLRCGGMRRGGRNGKVLTPRG